MDGAPASSPYPAPATGKVRSQEVGGRGDGVERLGVSPSGAVPGADLGGSSKYSSENLED